MDNKKEMPEHIRKMFEQQQNGSGKFNANNLPKPPQNKIVPKIEEKPENTKIDNNDTTLPTDNKIVENVELKPKDDTKVNTKKSKGLSKKSKIATIVSVCLICVLAIGLTLFFVLKPKLIKLDAPVLTIHQLTNKTFLTVPYNSDAIKYEFYIQKDGTNEPKKYVQDNNNFYFENREIGKFTAWARYVTNNNKTMSDISKKVVFTYKQKLSSPIVSYSTNKQKLVWQNVLNADKYYVYYGTNSDEFVEVENGTNGVVEFDLKRLEEKNIKPNSYNLCVKAISNNNMYLESNFSNQIEYSYKVTLNSVTNATFCKSTNVLTIKIDPQKTNTKLYRIKVVYQNEEYVYNFKILEVINIITFDLNFTIQNSGYKTEDITQISISAIGENSFIEDSVFKDVLIEE